MKLVSFISLLFILGFLLVAIMGLHPMGEPLSHDNVFKNRNAADISDIKNIKSMDDYFLRNGQTETGSNNIVTSVVFDYRGFDTLGEGTVLFIAVCSISMLLYLFLKNKKEIVENKGFSKNVSRIISYTSFLLYPLILVFGSYLVVHGHLSPGGGFQGGAVMASGTALLLIGAIITRNSYITKKILSIFESVGLIIFISLGFLGLGISFLYNFLAADNSVFLGNIPFGPNPGYLNSGGILPLLSTAVGLEVFCGLSIILISLYSMTKPEKINSSDLDK